MPFLRVALTPAVRREQKELLARRLTDVIVEVLGKEPEQCHIVFEEVAENNWAVSGRLVSARRRDFESKDGPT